VTGVQTCALPISPKPQNPAIVEYEYVNWNEYESSFIICKGLNPSVINHIRGDKGSIGRLFLFISECPVILSQLGSPV
jgi:hypothetical protein